MAIDYTNQIEQLYVAYFDRPADVYGLAFWNSRLNNGGALSEISNQFSTSAEYVATFAGLDNFQVVSRIYQNLFNRIPDTNGLVYWVTGLNAHTVTIANVVEVITNAALANPATEVDHISIVSKVAAATAFTHALDTPEEIAGYAGSGPALIAKQWLAPIHDASTLAAATDTATLNAAVAGVVATPSTTNILSPSLDNLYGGAGNDTFSATQSTLELGDSIHGGAGTDTLTVSISGPSGYSVNGFLADSVEVIEVKSLAQGASLIDFSDVTGLTGVVSRETDGAALTFQDIQSVNNVAIKIIDTLETHTFTYDAHAYTAGVDTVDLTLQEIRNATINFATTHDTPVGASLVDQVNLHSVNVINTVADLNVGNNLAVLNIDGNADLRIVAALDPNLTTVDAHGLIANLRLDLSNEALNSTVIGAHGNNYLDFGLEAHNKTITTFEGNDTILAAVGQNIIDSGAGNDSILSGTSNDTITTGDGNDFVHDLGGNDRISTGAGDDIVDLLTQRTPLTDIGNDYIDLGTGDDRLIIDAHDLEVYDTIIGGTGTDTIELHNTGSSDALGHVLASETQRTTGIEVFDLRETKITLELTDHLVDTADGKSLTVRTIDSTFDSAVGQTVDIRGITTPQFHVGLDGGLTKDTVIANENTVNSSSSLHFGDGLLGRNTAVQDTLVIYNGANISATDSINITGLERIELKSATGEATTWSIDLTDALLDQTTDVNAAVAGTQGTVTINVSPNVPQNSKLYINTIDVIASDVNVLVERNSNVTVYVNNVQVIANGEVAAYDAINIGPGVLNVQTEMHFTTNADSLVGTGLGDTFYADSAAQITHADFADGLGGTDTLVLGAGLYNGLTLFSQFDQAVLNNIEVLTISDQPGYAVHFADSPTESYNFNTFNLTAGNDIVDFAQSSHTFNTGDGNDIVTLAAGAHDVTVNGGGGTDWVHFAEGAASGSSSLFISEVENVHGNDEFNTVTILDTNTVAVSLNLLGGDDTVQGSVNADTLWVDGGTQGTGLDQVFGNGGADTLNVLHVEHVFGDADNTTFGGGNDTITTLNDVTATRDSVYGGGGDDTIILLNHEQDVVVFGHEAAHTGGNPVAVSSSNYDSAHLSSTGDTITNFHAGAVLPDLNLATTTEDALDFSGLIGFTGAAPHVVIGSLADGIDLATGVGANQGGIGVLWNANLTEIVDNAGTTFVTGGLSAGHISINDNGEAVIAFTNDAEGDNVASVTLAYVTDTDAGVGQTWEVTIIGTVTFDQLTGLNSGTLAAENFRVAAIA